MSFTFSPPPTYADVTVIDDKTQKARFNPIWLKWFLDLAQVLTSSGVASGNVVHDNVTGLQGGTSGQYYHLTQAEYTGTGSGVFVRAGAPTVGGLWTFTGTVFAAGYQSADTSPGISTTITTAGLVGKTITVKNGLITGFA